jgi:hypothetical protein
MVASNRRKNPRVPCSYEGKVLGPRGSLRGTVKNLSVGGFYLASKELLPLGTSVAAEIVIDGQKLQATAEVRHHQRIHDEPGMGLKFVRVDSAMLAAVQKAVEAHLADGSPSSP